MIKVTTRLGDIYFDADFDNEEEALERAKLWASAGSGEVIITHNEEMFTIEQFASRHAF